MKKALDKVRHPRAFNFFNNVCSVKSQQSDNQTTNLLFIVSYDKYIKTNYNICKSQFFNVRWSKDSAAIGF
jgi:uncharacterized protein (UPF0262 family)